MENLRGDIRESMEAKIQDYFARINFQDKAEVDLKTLTKLQLCHTSSIAFENIDSFTEQEVKIDSDSLFEKLVYRKRGGYCFEQNLLFYEVLKHLGFNVRPVAARVMIGYNEDEKPKRTHLLSLIDIDGAQYLSDVGFGSNTPALPVKFILEEEQENLHDTVRINKLGADYKFETKVVGEWKTLHCFNFDHVYNSDFELANFYIYAHPTSKFRNRLMISKIIQEGRITLSDLNFSFYPYDGEIVKKTITTEEELEKFLLKEFELPEEVLSKKLLEKLNLLN